jgi:ATP/maltotriose-dependent transcriptional regulator MalT
MTGRAVRLYNSLTRRIEALEPISSREVGIYTCGPTVQLRTPEADALSDRELEVLTLISRGETNAGAAARLFISEATVKTHLLHIYAKLGVNDRAAAVAVAYERGLLVPDAQR